MAVVFWTWQTNPPNTIVIMGCVTNPGIPIDPAHPGTVRTAITKARGMTPASDRIAFVSHANRDGNVQTVAVLMMDGREKNDPVIHPGDVLFVPAKGGFKANPEMDAPSRDPATKRLANYIITQF